MSKYENIKFKYPNLTIKDGYFYMFDHVVDILLQIVDDGSPAFSYPLDSPLQYGVISSEYDGVNFWTLESSGDNVYIKRWLVEGYICKLQDNFDMTAGGGHKYSSQSFTVEHYHATISGVCNVGSTNIPMTGGYATKLASGMSVTLGPNSTNHKETIDVQDAGDGWVTLQNPTEYSYMPSDPINFYTNIWLFNDYDGEVSTGAIYKFNAYGGSYTMKYSGGEYKGVTACTFITTNAFSEYGEVHSLAFVKGDNLLFLNPEPIGVDFSVYRSMVLKNMDMQKGELIDIFDISIVDENIYKLQEKAYIKDITHTFEGYGYQVEPFQALITSLLVSSNPAVLAADGISSTDISAVVLDQYSKPKPGLLVTFSIGEDSDAGGTITVPTTGTDASGKAITTFVVSNTPGFVQIVANVYQA